MDEENVEEAHWIRIVSVYASIVDSVCRKSGGGRVAHPHYATPPPLSNAPSSLLYEIRVIERCWSGRARLPGTEKPGSRVCRIVGYRSR